jgi:hypothetical protein
MAAIHRLVHHSIILEFYDASQRAQKAGEAARNPAAGKPPRNAPRWLRSVACPAPQASLPPSAKAARTTLAPWEADETAMSQGSVLIVAGKKRRWNPPSRLGDWLPPSHTTGTAVLTQAAVVSALGTLLEG